MRIFSNALLNEEVDGIINNDFPEHTTIVSAIIHTAEKDFYPNNVICLEEQHDYNNLTHVTVVTLVMGNLEYKKLLVANRDNFQISIYKDYNGKRTRVRYKGVLISSPADAMAPDSIREFTDNAVDGDIVQVEIQCVSFLYSILKQITINAVGNNTTVEDVIRYYLNTEMSKVKINNVPMNPIIDMVKPHNTRKYRAIELKKSIGLLDIPTYLQKAYGVYNGNIGTYIHHKDNKEVISVFPLYNNDKPAEGIRLCMYISDTPGLPDLSNKTVLLDNNILKILVQSDIGRMDDGDLADYDIGGGFKTTNSNQVLDRTFTKTGNKLTADSSKMIDSQSNNSKNSMSNVKMLEPTDNLYAVRSEIMKNKSTLVQAQWNFSRPDYLFPSMGVDIVRVRYGKIIREKGILISSFTKSDNKYRNSSTLLNVLIN